MQDQGLPKVPGHATATVAVVDGFGVVCTRQLVGAQEMLGMGWKRDEGWHAER